MRTGLSLGTGLEAGAVPPAVALPARPAVLVALPDLFLLQASGTHVVTLSPYFSGAGLAYSATGPGVAIDPATGALTLLTDLPSDGAEVVVTASNTVGTAVARFRLTVRIAPEALPDTGPDIGAERPLAPPVALGQIADAVFALGTGTASLSGQAGFAGEALTYALAEAPEGVFVHPGSGLVVIPRDRPLDRARVVLLAQNAAGAAAQTFTVSLRRRTADFADPALLGDVVFPFDPDQPAWTHDPAGFARLVPPLKTRVHSRWAGAEGDGRYRCLARWMAGNPEALGARPFSFTLRLVQKGADLAGLRVDVAQPGAGQRMLQVHQYTGSATASTMLGWRAVGWDWGQWTWVEAEIDGAQLRARLYAEGMAAPDWQLAVPVTVPDGGAFGPGGFPRLSVSPDIDIRRLEFHPLAHAIESTPPAALDADWSLVQFTEQK